MQPCMNITGMLDLGGSDPVATAQTKSVPSHPKTPSGGLFVPQALRIRT